MAEQIERVAKLFEAGDYPDKGLSITEQDVQTLVDAFDAEIPVRIQHVDTAFDGMLGCVTAVWRRGKELLGRIRFSPDTWSLIDRCGARRLSVGMQVSPLRLMEVSIVDHPRVATARVFSGDGAAVTFSGVLEYGWGGLASNDVLTRIETVLNPTRLDDEGYPVYIEPYAWVESLYENTVVINRGGRWFRLALEVTDGEVELGTPEEVVRDWRPVTTGGREEAASYSRARTHMEDTEMADAGVITLNAGELDAKLAAARQEGAAQAEAYYAAEREQARREAAAEAQVSGWLKDGRISEAQAPFARVLVAADETAEAFSEFVNAGVQAGPEGSAGESISGGPEGDAGLTKLWAGLGITEAQAEEINTKYGA